MKTMDEILEKFWYANSKPGYWLFPLYGNLFDSIRL